MTTTASTTTTRRPVPAPPAALTAFVDHVRAALGSGGPDAERASARVAAAVSAYAPSIEVLTHEQRHGDDELRSRLVHTEPGLSVVALAVRPGQSTSIHDHLTWCVVTVLQGDEDETVYADRGDHLVEVERSVNPVGSVTAFAPPGDIHRVRNVSSTTAVSLHVYGADLSEHGSSVRRVYDLPVLAG